MTQQARNGLTDLRSQTQRLRAFMNAEVRSRLQLTGDQQEQIRAILQTGFQQARPFRESLAELQWKTLEKAIAVLTDDQRSEWEQIEARYLQAAEGSFGSKRISGRGPAKDGGAQQIDAPGLRRGRTQQRQQGAVGRRPTRPKSQD